MAQAERWVFFDGQFRRYGEIRIGLLTHALHYGTGVFEGLRAYWNEEEEQLRLLQPEAHFSRLATSARILGADLSFTPSELARVAIELLQRNAFREDVYVRPLLFAATEEVGIRLHDLRFSFAMIAVPFGRYLDTTNGIRCVVSTWRRVSDNAIPARAKITGSYVNSSLAKTEAVRRGYDDAIELTSDGHVAEGSAANLFIVRRGAIATPPVTDDILEGITRRLVIELARDELGHVVAERSIDRTELYAADEVLLCGTGVEIAGVVEVDDRVVGTGTIGPLTGEIKRLYLAAAHGDLPAYHSWSVVVPKPTPA